MTSLMFFTPLNVENNESKYYLLKINKLQYIREGLRTSVKSLQLKKKKKKKKKRIGVSIINCGEKCAKRKAIF